MSNLSLSGRIILVNHENVGGSQIYATDQRIEIGSVYTRKQDIDRGPAYKNKIINTYSIKTSEQIGRGISGLH